MDSFVYKKVTSQVMPNFTDQILSSCDRNKFLLGAFIDLLNAVDMIDHLLS